MLLERTGNELEKMHFRRVFISLRLLITHPPLHPEKNSEDLIINNNQKYYARLSRASVNKGNKVYPYMV